MVSPWLRYEAYDIKVCTTNAKYHCAVLVPVSGLGAARFRRGCWVPAAKAAAEAARHLYLSRMQAGWLALQLAGIA
jgi:hypothetical protein